MKKVIVIVLIVIILLLGGVICKKKFFDKPKTEDKPIVDKIELGKKQYINQKEKIYIEDTEDYLIITEKVKWDVPDTKPGVTVSFAIKIPYILHVDGIDYEGFCIIGSSTKPSNDKNPKYSFEVTNLTENYETQVLVEEK